ncbi:hypothetical protein NSU08_18550 [Paenibacillus sp. FSL H7-0331]
MSLSSFINDILLNITVSYFNETREQLPHGDLLPGYCDIVPRS